MSKVRIEPEFKIYSGYTYKTKRYKRTIQVSAKGLNKKGWGYLLAKCLADRSRLREESVGDSNIFKRAIDLLRGEAQVLEILNIPPASITRFEMKYVFEVLEEILLKSESKDSIRTRCSSIFRKYVYSFAQNLGFGELITKQTTRHTTKLHAAALPRSMISDFPDSSLSEIDLASPLAALRHDTLKDLYKAARNRAEIDLKKIVDACITELRLWEAVREELDRLSQCDFTDEEQRLCEEARKHGSKWALKEFGSFTDAIRLGLYCKSAKNAFGDRRHGDTYGFPGIRTLVTSYFKLNKNQYSGVYPFHILLLPVRIHSNELIAIFLLIQCLTGWNANSIINLTTDRIEFETSGAGMHGGSVAIQGYKSRTDDDTPPVVLDSSIPYAIYALKLIVWNNLQFRKAGLISPNETRLWYSRSLERESENNLLEQYIGFQGALESFIGRHNLPKFSFDQIRPQVLAVEQLRTLDIDHVRSVAGHASITTTGHYQNQDLFNRLNSAINLEFQRRLEETVQFRMEEVGEILPIRMLRGWKSDSNLIMPLGDGGSCTNPEAPPFAEYLSGDICSGTNCHVGAGCANRKIILDRERIEELVRRRKYYRGNWQRLLQENPELFRKTHSPRILFCLGLYDFVQTSRYQNVLRQIEAKVEG